MHFLFLVLNITFIIVETLTVILFGIDSRYYLEM